MSQVGLFTLFRTLSLDVVAGAMASGYFAAWLLEIDPPLVWWVALPVSVWVIYTTDHLIDAWRLGGGAHTTRHRFHHTYKRPLLVAWIVGGLFCVSWVPWQAPAGLLRFGIFMGGLAAGHLLLVIAIGSRVHALLVKELGVALVYALGVWGGVAVLAPQPIPPAFFLGLGQFFLLALINLLFFSLYERESDLRDGHTSFVLAVGPQRTKRLIGILAGMVVGLGLAALALSNAFRNLVGQTVLLLMLSGLIFIAFRSEIFSANERYRIWGDGIFMLPGIVAFF